MRSAERCICHASSTSAVVTYTPSGPQTLNFNIDGMYIVQSVQRYDGTVPLIQDRDGYLRVFVTANLANTETPDVRVRLYHSGALVQTYTLNAPGATSIVGENGSPPCRIAVCCNSPFVIRFAGIRSGLLTLDIRGVVRGVLRKF